MTEAKKIYTQPGWILYRGMCDVIDTQNSLQLSDDSNKSELRFTARMYEILWTIQFAAVKMDRNSCEVTLKVIKADPAEAPEDELMALAGYVLRREFALLDAMLIIGTPCEVTFDNGEAVT